MCARTQDLTQARRKVASKKSSVALFQWMLPSVLKAVLIDFPARAKAASTLSRSWRLRWRTWITWTKDDSKPERKKRSRSRWKIWWRNEKRIEERGKCCDLFRLRRKSHRDCDRECLKVQCHAWPRPYSALSSKSELPHAAPFPVAWEWMEITTKSSSV